MLNQNNVFNKELMSEILNDKVLEVKDSQDDEITYCSESGNCKNINCYKLASLYKEWASKKGYDLFSYVGRDGLFYCELIKDIWTKSSEIRFSTSSVKPSGKTEYEAIFKACEYIIKLKNAYQGDK